MSSSRPPAGSGPRRRAPKQARSKEKVRKILDATRRLLERDGADAITTNRIAQEAGVGVGSVYEYFPNKEAIVLGVIEDLSRQEIDAITGVLHDVDSIRFRETVYRVVEATFDLYVENYKVFVALYALTSQMRSVGHRPGENLVMQLVKTRLGPVIEELAVDDIEIAAFVVFHTVESLISRMLEHGRQWDQPTCVNEITDVVCRYLGIE